jgi:Flp pilus assembly protein TadD
MKEAGLPLNPRTVHDGWPRLVLGSLGLWIVIQLVYLPAVNGTAVWDDGYMLTVNPVMSDPHGLRRIWFDPFSVLVYYPLTLSVLWTECRLFGLADLTGYHLVNIALHAVNAVMIWRLLRRLEVRGAFSAALLWGIHPVDVESVAWITELKNVLSVLFYLPSVAALLRFFDPSPNHRTPRRWLWYALGLAGFVLALSAKTTAVTLPGAVLLLVWYRTGHLRVRDFLAMAPFAVIAAAAGILTQHIEVHQTGVWRPQWNLSIPQQLVLAGRALWFYAAKVFWPVGISFTYPRWTIDPTQLWQWAFPAAAVAVAAALAAARNKIGRGPLTGVLFFAGTLVPALGFFHVLYQQFSYVADHFQYLSSIGLIAVVTGGVARLGLSRGALISASVAAAAVLAGTTAVSARRFTSDQAVWTDVLTRDPANPFAHINVASDLIDSRQYDAAGPHLTAAECHPLLQAGAWSGRGRIAEARGQYPLALSCYANAVKFDPDDPRAQFQFGTMLYVAGRLPDAEAHLRAAIAIRPRWAEPHDNLGVILLHLGRPGEAKTEFETAARLDPALPLVRHHLDEVSKQMPDGTRPVEPARN